MTLDHLKTFKTNRPVNSAAISPIRDQVRVVDDPNPGAEAFVSRRSLARHPALWQSTCLLC
jgi:hypothetical protein